MLIHFATAFPPVFKANCLSAAKLVGIKFPGMYPAAHPIIADTTTEHTFISGQFLVWHFHIRHPTCL